MAIKVPVEANRLPGYIVKDGVTLVAGMVIAKDPSVGAGSTIMLSDGTTTNAPLGLALDTNVSYDDPQQYYDDFARGGLVSSTYGPVIAEIWDDGRGSPYDNTQSYTVNEPLYCGADGRITNQLAGLLQVGWVDKVPTSSSATLKIRVLIP